jgi:PadR family transcriptional regulator, regulatory protein PadR
VPQRITRPTLSLLEAFVADPLRSWYGLELMDCTGLQSGTVYPILHRLTKDGWLSVAQEEVDPATEGRPRRRLYKLTGTGETNARRELKLRSKRFTSVSGFSPRLGEAKA